MSAFLSFLSAHQTEVWHLTLQHFFLVVAATGAATALGIPVGIFLTRKPSFSKPVLGLANMVQTIPSLALFGFLIPVLGDYGIGKLPALIALFLYSLLPIIQNTYTGINSIDPSVREAGRGMGMTDFQLLLQVDLPLASGVILAGIRVATVISVGTATIAAAIGAGGLGVLIFRGLRMSDNLLILAGAIPAALMALFADFSLGVVEHLFFPRWNGKERAEQSPVSMRVRGFAVLLIVFFLAFFSIQAIFHSSFTAPPEIVIGAKDFPEQSILGEILAELIESRTGLRVRRDFDLGGDLCHRALVSGGIDGYVEYTGTAYTEILKHKPIPDPAKVYETVKQEYASKWNLEWLPPLGFNNTFAILVRGTTAKQDHLKTISDIVPYAPGWRVAFGQDFMSRKDGYPGFVRTYGLRFKGIPSEMDLTLTYRALASGQVDLIAGNSTDGLIEKLHLYQLNDNLHYFPPYQAAPVFRRAILERYPAVRSGLLLLAGKISSLEMRRMNDEVDVEHKSVKEVVREFLSGLRK